MRLTIGTCGICNNRKIGKQMKNFVANKEYVEITLILSDGRRALHGICRDCVADLTNNKIKKIFRRIKDTWIDDMINYGSNSTERVERLSVVGWGVGDNPSTLYYINK